LTIVGGPTWDTIDEADRAALSGVLQDAAVCATDQIIPQAGELAAWFREQGNNVNEVARAPFIEAVKAMHTGEMAAWDQDTYARLQAIE
jgi:TRAP-type C4-dicarboxylate transport system substrate-binding protein